MSFRSHERYNAPIIAAKLVSALLAASRAGAGRPGSATVQASVSTSRRRASEQDNTEASHNQCRRAHTRRSSSSSSSKRTVVDNDHAYRSGLLQPQSFRCKRYAAPTADQRQRPEQLPAIVKHDFRRLCWPVVAVVVGRGAAGRWIGKDSRQVGEAQR